MDPRTIALLVIVATPALGADDYVGSKACAGCHKAVYNAYVKTPMGRAATPASEHLGLATPRASVQHDKFDRRFEVYVEDGKLYQAEVGEKFRSVHPVEYALGSGENGLSFIVRRGDHLFQAPLSYYSRARGWGLSPGYEFADLGFNRPIAAMCIACHSGRPQPVAQRNGQFLDPPFLELSIGCESCHGPGRVHIQSGGGKQNIVNPKRLASARAEDICMNCHQGGDTRILQPGKTALDFRPGQALSDTVAIFKLPRTKEAADVDLLEHHESMRLSRCYRESKGTLNCITCHNPHAAADYRAACLGCHAKPFAATHPAKDSDCVSCHMPKRDIGFIAHSALTNHRIVRQRDEGLPEAASRTPTIWFTSTVRRAKRCLCSLLSRRMGNWPTGGPATLSDSWSCWTAQPKRFPTNRLFSPRWVVAHSERSRLIPPSNTSRKRWNAALRHTQRTKTSIRHWPAQTAWKTRLRHCGEVLSWRPTLRCCIKPSRCATSN